MEKNKFLSLSNSLENLLFPPGKYTLTQLLNLTPYFSTGVKFTLQQHQKLMRQLFDIDEEKIWWVVKAEYGEVDAKVLLIVLMLQLIGREKRDIGGYNQGIKNHAVNKDSNLTSPRSKTTRALYMSNQQTIILHYIKENLMNFLKLLSNEPNSQDPMLEGEDLQPLSILFKVDRNKKFASNFSIFNKALKLKASVMAKELQNRIQISEQQLVSLQGLSYVVTVKQQIHCRGKDMRIIGCEDSQIFIDSSVRSLYIVNCNNCTIYIAACEKIAFVDKCEKIFFTTATNLLRICNTVDSSIFYYGTSPIILTGDNRSVSIGPNNCPSKELKGHIKSAGIQLSQKYYGMFQQILSKNMNKQKQGSNSNTNNNSNYTKMQLQDFDLLVMPIKSEQEMKKQKENIEENILAPMEYVKQLQNRNNYYNSFKAKISKSKLSPQMTRNLHSALQGNFKEWLIGKGYTKNLNDLVKMLDKK